MTDPRFRTGRGGRHFPGSPAVAATRSQATRLDLPGAPSTEPPVGGPPPTTVPSGGPLPRPLGDAPPEPPAEPPAAPPGDATPGAPGGGWARPTNRAALRLALLALAGGVAFDLGLRGSLANVVVSIAVLVVVAALLTDERLVNVQSRWLAVGAVVPAVLLAVRASPWLVTLNWLAILGLIGVAIAQARSGSLVDTSPSRLLRRLVWAAGRTFRAPLLLRPLVPRPSGATFNQVGRVAVALAIALPMLAIVVALLAAADPVFAGMVLPDVEPGPVPGHVILVGIFALVVLAAAAAADGDSDDWPSWGGLGALEIGTMLGLAVAVLGLFVVSQLVALTDAGDRLVADSGLTPAEYARSGFFQLCWATAVLVGFLGLARALSGAEVLNHRLIRALGAMVPLLALGLVGVSLRRMALYDEAFGLTMLRLWVVGAALWMGAVFIMFALRSLGAGGGRDWVVAGSGAAALVLLLAANLGNAEGFVVRHNVARAEDGAELDGGYLGDLSADALPDIVASLDDAPPGRIRNDLVDALACRDEGELIGTASLNLAQARAESALDDVHLTDAALAEAGQDGSSCYYRD
jgi:Domain of unknown function (DUF4173)